MKKAWNLSPVLQIIQKFQKNIALVYIYQLTKFSGLMSCVQKIYSKMSHVPCPNIHHDITDLVNYRIIKNTKTWISWEWNITFLWNKKIICLCLGWYIFRSYHSVANVTRKCVSCEFMSVAVWDQVYVHFLTLDLISLILVPCVIIGQYVRCKTKARVTSIKLEMNKIGKKCIVRGTSYFSK